MKKIHKIFLHLSLSLQAFAQYSYAQVANYNYVQFANKEQEDTCAWKKNSEYRDDKEILKAIDCLNGNMNIASKGIKDLEETLSDIVKNLALAREHAVQATKFRLIYEKTGDLRAKSAAESSEDLQFRAFELFDRARRRLSSLQSTRDDWIMTLKYIQNRVNDLELLSKLLSARQK